MPDWLYWTATELFEVDVAGRLLLASLLGSVIGLERERAQKAAGFRTNMLICLGAALVMEVSRALAEEWGSPVDASRMAGQVVSGIGFIGAGAILVARGQVVIGLTTAATIWVVAAVGLAVGARAYTHAVGGTLLIVTALTLFTRIENLMFGHDRPRAFEIELTPTDEAFERVTRALHQGSPSARLIEIVKADDGIRLVAEVRATKTERDDFLERLAGLPEVRRVALAALRTRPVDG